jgi:hypothetical protein
MQNIGSVITTQDPHQPLGQIRTLSHNVTHCSADHGVESSEVDEDHECSLRDPISFLFSVLWRQMTNESPRGSLHPNS